MNELSPNLLAVQCLSLENLLQLKVRAIVDFLFRLSFRTVRLTREKWDERCSGGVTIHRLSDVVKKRHSTRSPAFDLLGYGWTAVGPLRTISLGSH